MQEVSLAQVPARDPDDSYRVDPELERRLEEELSQRNA